MKRYVATFYRGRWLYVLVLLLLLAGAIFGSYTLASAYTATARLWFDQPPLSSVLGQNQNTGLGPGQQQGLVLAQLLQSDSFVTAVVKGTKDAGKITGVTETDERYLKQVRKELSYETLGGNMVQISASGKDPLLMQQLVDNTVTQFRNWSQQSESQQATAETQYYQHQVQTYQQQLQTAQKALTDFTTQHPNLGPDASPTLLTQLSALQQNVSQAMTDYNSAVAKASQAGAASNISSGGNTGAFQVLDQPTVPTSSRASLSHQIKYGMLGVVASFALVLAAIVVVTWQDTTIRDLDDAAALGGAPVLAIVPRLKLQPARSSRRSAGGAADRLQAEPGGGQVAVNVAHMRREPRRRLQRPI